MENYLKCSYIGEEWVLCRNRVYIPSDYTVFTSDFKHKNKYCVMT